MWEWCTKRAPQAPQSAVLEDRKMQLEKVDRVIATTVGAVVAVGTPFGVYASIARYGELTGSTWLLWTIISSLAVYAGIGIIRWAQR